MLELTDLVKAFQEQNSCYVYFRACVVTVRGQPDIAWTAAAYDKDPEQPDARLLCLANARCREKRLLSMESVLLHLLYALDFKLGEEEFQKVEQKRA